VRKGRREGRCAQIEASRRVLDRERGINMYCDHGMRLRVRHFGCRVAEEAVLCRGTKWHSPAARAIMADVVTISVMSQHPPSFEVSERRDRSTTVLLGSLYSYSDD
jgi:hypothetical protein